MKKKGMRYGTVFFLLVATAFVTAVGTYFYVSRLVDGLGRNQQIYTKLNKVNELINNYYILTIDPVSGNDIILDGITDGYIQGLNDEYAYYLNEKNYRLASNLTDASRVGIGIRAGFEKESEEILVEFVSWGSPAEAAGIRAGDVITQIDGIPVTEIGYRTAVASLSGALDSTVTLTVRRSGQVSLLNFVIARTTFESKTVESRVVENGIGYLFINEFSSKTASELSAALNSLRGLGCNSYILDVRFNEGGDLNGMLAALDLLMPSGIMVSVREKSSEEPVSYYSDEKSLTEPFVLLQNRKTSDVAEVFTSALRDTQTAQIVGTVSRGKGVGQRDIPLSDGTAIHISTYEYITPSGERFNGIGIAPNQNVSLSEEKENNFFDLDAAEDDQLQAAIRLLTEQMGN